MISVDNGGGSASGGCNKEFFLRTGRTPLKEMNLILFFLLQKLVLCPR
jgi:hypothetical protein